MLSPIGPFPAPKPDASISPVPEKWRVAIRPPAAVGALTHYPQGDVDLRSARWIAIAGVPAVLLGAALALWLPQRVLVILFGPEYAEGASILRVLVWVLPLQGFRLLLRQVLVAFHLQRMDTRNLSLGVLTNVIIDLLLIPSLGALGCAISTICSEIVIVAASQLTVRLRVMNGAS